MFTVDCGCKADCKTFDEAVVLAAHISVADGRVVKIVKDWGNETSVWSISMNHAKKG